MPSFRLLPLEVPARAVRSVSVLEVDGKAPFRDFAGRMRKAGKKADLRKIDALLDDLALGRTLPPNACKPLNRGTKEADDWQEFELRKNQLRVYFFLIPPDNSIVVIGEFKKGNKQQTAAIAEFRRLKEAFKTHYENEEE
ncbi:MAG: hypothetical protein AAFZ52_08670 [Bacteroidota bacterium]